MTRNDRCRTLAVFAVLTALVPSARVASAETAASAARPRSGPRKPLAQTLTGQAKADYEAGKLLFGDGDYAGALIKLESAYELGKDPRLLYNIATCQKSQRHYAKAVASLRRYLADDTQLSLAERKAVGDTIGVLEPFTTRLTVRVNEAGAQIIIDDEPAGTSPLASPLVVDIGERRLKVTKDGFTPFEKTMPVGGSADVLVDAKLERVVREGHLTVNAPAGAAVFLDEKPLGTGRVEQTVPAGGHQLRINAAGMRPYLTEVVVQDRETRTLDIVLEAEPPPKLRVAVGCGDAQPRGPDEGLVAYLDGNDVLGASGVKKSWDADQGTNVVRYAEYPVEPGEHVLRLRVPGCKSLDHRIAVKRPDGGDVVGALELDKNVLLKGPQGTPGWGRVGVAFWMPFTVGQVGALPDAYTLNAADLKGFAVDVGVVTRWFSAGLDFGYAAGTATRTSFNSNYQLPGSASTHVTRGSLRLGPRFPFNVVSFGFGALAGLEQLDYEQVLTGGIGGFFGTYAELVIEPLCSFGVFSKFDAGIDTNHSSGNGPTGVFSMSFGALFAPSSACKKERNTQFGLREGASPSSPPPASPPAVVPASALVLPPPPAAPPTVLSTAAAAQPALPPPAAPGPLAPTATPRSP